MSARSVPERVARKQHSISAKLDEEAKRLLALEAEERGVTQSQIVLEALWKKPHAATPLTGATREIVRLCHDIRRHLQCEKETPTTGELIACLTELVHRLSALFELVRHERLK